MTDKNILIVNTHSNILPLLNLFNGLKNRGARLRFLTFNFELLVKLKEKNISGRRIKKFKGINNILSFIFYIIFFPIWIWAVLGVVMHYKYKIKINAVVCFDCMEKLIFTPVAGLFGMDVVWIELPGESTEKKTKPIKAILRILSGRARILTFLELTKSGLINSKINPETITNINPGIKPGGSSRQDNIFSRLAENEKQKSKFFTLGTALDPNSTQGLETLFQAAKKCLTVIPNLQLIIIGEGKGRRGMWWMAKKLEIDGLVWFVGEQKNLGKWFNNFDIFISTYSRLRLSDINLLLEAMEYKLPIIGPVNIGLENIIKQNITGIITETNESEKLAREIITLKQNRRLRLELGENARKTVDKNYSLDNMVKEFEKIINL